MSKEVLANGRDISCKAGGHSVPIAFPDVCLSPPAPPAVPLPLPYPLNAKSGDTDEGSKSVSIKGQPIMLRDLSCYSQCVGDKAATKQFGMGLVTHQMEGKVYFASWSMDVEVEGKSVVRHLDMTTANHASKPGNSAPGINKKGASGGGKGFDCSQVLAKYPVEAYAEQNKKKTGVYKGKQAHHVIQNAFFQSKRGTNAPGVCPGYSEGSAPCIPLGDGTNPLTEHGRVSKLQKKAAKDLRVSNKAPTYKTARAGAKTQLMAKPKPGLSSKESECILRKVDRYFKKACAGGTTNLRTPGTSNAVQQVSKSLGSKFGLVK